MTQKTNLFNCCDPSNIIENYCPKIDDSILTWPATKAGEIATLPCPGGHSENNATKYCMENGEWYISPESNRIWTNYSNCWEFVDNETGLVEINPDIYKKLKDLEIRMKYIPILKIIAEVGYSLSLFFLITSLLIFFCIKRLHCPRNKLHMNLFVSFIMRGITYLLKDFLLVNGLALKTDLVYADGNRQYYKESNYWGCKLLMAAKNYFILSNYMLILMENFYLNNLMFLTLSTNHKHVVLYCILGWGIPFILIGIWVIMKIQYSDIVCWTLLDQFDNYLIRLPIRIIVIVNFVFFLIILRLLCGKINSMNIQHRRVRYRRLIKSTLTLVLLLAIPYTLSEMASYCSNPLLEIIWIFCDQTFTAFQGLIVALLYCLLNADVQSEIRQKYRSMHNRDMRCSRSRTISNTQQFVIQEDNFDSPRVYWHKDKNGDNSINIIHAAA